MQHLQRAERVTFVEQLVDRARSVLRAAEPEPDLKRKQPERLPGQDADGLRAADARDDVRLPLVRVDCGAARVLQRSEAAEVGAVAVRDRDSLEVARTTTERARRSRPAARARMGSPRL